MENLKDINKILPLIHRHLEPDDKGQWQVREQPEEIRHPICPLNMYFEGDNIIQSQCDFDTFTRSCSEDCKRNINEPPKSDWLPCKQCGMLILRNKQRCPNCGVVDPLNRGIVEPPDIESVKKITQRSKLLRKELCWVDKDAVEEAFVCPAIDCDKCFAQYGVCQLRKVKLPENPYQQQLNSIKSGTGIEGRQGNILKGASDVFEATIYQIKESLLKQGFEVQE